MKKTIISLSIVIVVFVITTIAMSLMIINGNDYLKNFDIISVSNINTKYNIKFERVKAAKYYEVVIYNEDNSIFYENKVKNNNLVLNLDDIEYNSNYKLYIYAYDEQGDKIVVNNPYEFSYAEPTFSKDNKIVLGNQDDYKLKIDGDLSKKEYYIALLDNKYVIKKEKLTKNEYIISKKLFAGLKQVLTVNLYDNNEVINQIQLYSNISPVSDIKITSPKDGDTLDLSDINLAYEGGENATSYSLQIFKDDVLLKDITINNKDLIVSSEFFKKGNNYKLKVNALFDGYVGYTKSSEVNFKISSKDTLKPAYINVDSEHIKGNDKIELLNPNSGGKIYYTIDGTEPTEKSILYTEPIEVKENMVIKTIIKERNKNDSLISEFKVNIADKDNYNIYLSSDMNDDLEDIILKVKDNLEKKNVKVIMNNEKDSINTRISDAKNNNSDLYLAIYSKHISENSGIECWIKNTTSHSYSLANLLYKDLIAIYNSDNNKDISYSAGSIDELSNESIGNSILLNFDFIDNEEDKKWLTDNTENISDSITNSILKYFSLI